MRIYALYVSVGIFGCSAIAVAACSSTTTTSDDAGTIGSADDAGATDTGATATPETGSTPDTGTNTPDGADAGLACDIPDGSDSCDTCSLMNCCAQENACQSEALSDAGTTDCEDIFSCVQDCLVPPADSGVDGGTLSDCASTCSAGHTSQGNMDFSALETCLANTCASNCQ